ncbi:hypothetical protein CK500_12875 [Halorubrum salipaludis]|uniref:Ubiquinone biosynthesis protein UbiA n=1 Tax=Halorubrum salipaludis TaxID=2032630 RepID=A0A2A2FEF0_9EURY|nr:UbiA family prenyltransferase [Halorubrum salipaludis]PAU83012.1 hypothetical protein CK500_12875 [Halorubrum salipaludis]
MSDPRPTDSAADSPEGPGRPEASGPAEASDPSEGPDPSETPGHRDRAVALARLVRPAFLGPAVATAAVGGLLAPAPAGPVLVGHALAVGLAVYAAHLRDALVDRFRRGEEPPGGTTPRLLRRAFVAASLAFWAVVAGLWWTVGPVAALAVGPLWALAALHAPHLDVTPVGSATDYAVGVALALVGGYALQTGALAPDVLAVAAALGLALVAVTVSVDALDAAFDRQIGKQTVPVALGAAAADRLAATLFLAAGATVAVAVAAGALPWGALAAAAVCPASAAAVFARPRRRSVLAQMASLYPLAALLVAPVCLAGDAACGGILRLLV